MAVYFTYLYGVSCLAVVVFILVNIKYQRFSFYFLILLTFVYIFEVGFLSTRIAPFLGILFLLILSFFCSSIFREVKSLIIALGFKRFVTATSKSLILSVPLVLALLASFKIISIRDNYIRSSMYSISVNSEVYNCRQPENLLLCSNTSETDVKVDLKITTDYIFSTMENYLLESTKVKVNDVEASVDGGSAQIEILLFDGESPAVPKSIKHIFNPPDCKWYYWLGYKVAQCIKHEIFSGINSAYDGVREGLRDEFNAKAEQFNTLTNQSGEETLILVERVLEEKTSEYKKEIHKLIDRVFLVINIIAVLAFGLIFFSFIKSFCYIWARFLYNKNNGAKLSSQPIENFEKRNLINASDITGSNDSAIKFTQKCLNENWYTCFDRDVTTENYGRLVIPKFNQMFFRRFVANKLHALKYSHGEVINGHASNDHKFIKIDLKHNQMVFFKMGALLAYSESINFKTKIEFKLASMLKLRWLFSIATGEGSIILKASGGSCEIIDGNEGSAIAPHQILAFDMLGEFSVDARSDPISVYLLGYTLIPEENTLTIRHSPQSPIAFPRFLKRVLFLITPV